MVQLDPLSTTNGPVSMPPKIELYVSSISSTLKLRNATEAARRCLRGYEVTEIDIASCALLCAALVIVSNHVRTVMRRRNRCGSESQQARPTSRSSS